MLFFMQNRTFGQGFRSATLITNKVPVMKPYISSNVTGYIYPGRRRGGGENGKWDKTGFKPRETYMIFPKMRGKIYSTFF